MNFGASARPAPIARPSRVRRRGLALCVALGCSLPLDAAARSGAEQGAGSETDSGAKGEKTAIWKSQAITVTLDASLERLDHGAAEAAELAFAEWLGAAALPKLEFASAHHLSVTGERDGTNAVVAAPIVFPGHEDDLAVTLLFKDGAGRIVEADIVLNTRRHLRVLEGAPDSGATSSSCRAESENMTCGRIYDVQNVVTHEAGHFFGLPENPADTAATMFPCISRCETHKRSLGDSDRAAIASSYEATPATGTVQASACSVDVGAGAPQSALAWWSALALTCVELGRRRRARARRSGGQFRQHRPASTAAFSDGGKPERHE